VPILGILVCGLMIASEPGQTLIMSFIWMIAGLGFYFAYGIKKSKLNNPK
jgi:APA family basic amino acid/polyamine antiporter